MQIMFSGQRFQESPLNIMYLSQYQFQTLILYCRITKSTQKGVVQSPKHDVKHRQDRPDIDAMLARVKSVDLDMDTRLDAVKTIRKLQVMVMVYK